MDDFLQEYLGPEDPEAFPLAMVDSRYCCHVQSGDETSQRVNKLNSQDVRQSRWRLKAGC